MTCLSFLALHAADEHFVGAGGADCALRVAVRASVSVTARVVAASFRAPILSCA